MLRSILSQTALAAGLVLFTASHAAAQTPSGPSAESQSMLDVVLMYEAANPTNPLTADQLALLKDIRIHRDITNKSLFYYVLPMSMRQTAAGQDWSETPNPVALKVIEEIDRLNRINANKVAGLPTNDLTHSPGKDAIFNPTPTSTSTTPREENNGTEITEVVNALSSKTVGLSDADKAAFVEFVRLKLPSIGRTAPEGMNFDAALWQLASLMKTVPVLTLEVPVGFAFDQPTLAAFLKLRNGLPQVTFRQLGSAPTWELSKQGVVSGASPRNATSQATFVPSLNVDAEIFQNLNGTTSYTIGSAGGTMSLGLGYAGALAYGYGTLDSANDPLITDSRLNLAKQLPGFLSQDLSRNVSFNGYALCRFKGEVKLNMKIRLEKRAVGLVVPISSGSVVDSGVVNEPEINECVVYDDAGNPANMQNEEIKKIAGAFRQQHINKQLEIYRAALSVKEAIRTKAVNDANGWKYLPMPKENKLVTDWSSQRECKLVRTTQYCAEVTKKKFLGVTYKEYCSRWDYNVANQCNTYYKAVDRFVAVDVPVAYFDNDAQFNRVWDQEQRINFSGAEPVTLRIQAGNNICIQRKRTSSGLFERDRCQGLAKEVAGVAQGDDLPPPSNGNSGEILGDGVVNW